ncbi:MAG: Unknown protein [uncultured Sulfurovum sp.]|uniref:Outer membrane protein beta-barrel domain-containing protein n=1 Tax=uncultured Sulfurovum sp. TaxID=269237 RepID=A0A6S6SRZ0_9BACT|nr:MAG: Unknown protein [uncultured Sulfurovum sp.]
MKTKIFLTTLLLSLSTITLQAKESFSIETDPATFAFDGYALHLKKSFEEVPHMEFGIGVYAMDFPDAFVDMHSKNKDKGWDVRLNQGIGLFVDSYQQADLSGWFIGGQLALQEYELTLNGSKEKYDSMMLMGYGGYKFLLGEHTYAKLWGGVGYSNKVSGSNVVNQTTYDVPNLIPFGALHVGYTF